MSDILNFPLPEVRVYLRRDTLRSSGQLSKGFPKWTYQIREGPQIPKSKVTLTEFYLVGFLIFRKNNVIQMLQN